MRSCFLFFMLHSVLAKAQINSIPISLMWGEEKIIPEKNYYSKNIADSIQISELKGYITQLRGYVHGKAIPLMNSCLFTTDSAGTNTLTWKKKLDVDSISFTLGVDSITNVSGAMGGFLDPMYGMYWTWQSGYIHLKMEGRSRACRAPGNVFQYHLGGYSYPYNASVNVTLKIQNKNPVLVLPLDRWFEILSFQETDHMMSPCAKAVQWMKVFSEQIYLR